MNFSEVKYCDIANGIGVRTTVFVSGCRLHCENCFNREAWDFLAGKPFDESEQEKVLGSLEPGYVDGISILGGEPTEPENAQALAPFLERLRERYGSDKSVWLYSGRTWEQLTGKGDHASPDMARILSCTDVLVDGPFVQALYDITLRFRGSSNQRIIDVPASLAKGNVITWHDDPLFETHGLA